MGKQCQQIKIYVVRSSYTPNLILLEPAEKSVTHRHTHEIRIKWEEKENWENMAKNREPEEKNCNREQNSFQNWSTNASMHNLHVLSGFPIEGGGTGHSTMEDIPPLSRSVPPS